MDSKEEPMYIQTMLQVLYVALGESGSSINNQKIMEE
jgi:hypothetical protein